MYKRYIIDKTKEAINDTPVILIIGPRQSGKSTLAKTLCEEAWPARQLSLDHAATLSAAKSDPTGFIDSLTLPTAIDEIQRVPELLLAIKASVDKNRRAGRFLLTGSANILMLPKVSDSLAGRMEIITLWPLSMGEILGKKEQFLSALFSENFEIKNNQDSSLTRQSIMRYILRGGYPEIMTRHTENRQHAWFNSYITAILQRDVRDISNIDGLMQLPKLLTLLASRTGTLLNHADLARVSAIPQTTLSRYLTLLQTTFLTCLLPPWSNNYGKRIIKSPKLYLTDTGLAATLLGITTERCAKDAGLIGPLLENFVIMELMKQITWHNETIQLFHYRKTNGIEVDVVLENQAGNCCGIEIKASSSISERDFRGLKQLAETLGTRWVCGIILYTGDQLLPFGKKLYAVPLSTLWHNELR